MKRRSVTGRVDSDGYRIVQAPGHPLAREDGSIREHRMVLFDVIGPGVHPCHWCGWEVDWAVTYRPGGTAAERWSALIADHLNGDRLCNEPGNLVAACAYCNSNRGGMPRVGVQPAEFAGVPPWERPLFGNTPAVQGRRRRMPRPGRLTVPAVPVEVDEPVSAGEYREDERAAPPPARPPGPVRRRWRPVGWRWAAVAAAVPSWLLAGRWAGVLTVGVWWLGVRPVVRVRRGPAPVTARSFRSWDEVRAEVLGSAPCRPAEMPQTTPAAPTPRRIVDVPADRLPVLGDVPVVADDGGDPTDGVVVPMRRPMSGRPVGPPPPPRRR